MSKAPPAVLAEPYSQADLARFEILIFQSSNDAPKIRLKARSALALFLRVHGKDKCDMMLAALSKFHDDKDKRPDA